MGKYYIISINHLIDAFSKVEAGKEFDFTINTSESLLAESTISEDDILLASVSDKIYYKFDVIDRTENELRLKKIFEIEKSIEHNVDEEGIVSEISEEEYSSICDKLFNHLVNKNSSSEENVNEINTYIKEKYTGRFVFQVLTYLNELDHLNNIKPYFKQNIDPFYTSIKANEISLTSIFKTSENKLSKEELTFNDGKPRFFEDILFVWNNKNFYLSTEWTSGKESRLDLDSFKILIEKYYPEFSIIEENGFYIFSDKIISPPEVDQIDFELSSFQEACKNSGLVYTDELVSRFTSSLLTKPFVILTGLSGSGKTKLALSFVQWICENKTQYKIVPVGADWTNNEQLVGYPNGLDPMSYVTPDSGVLQLILEASKKENENKPYFMILDEMNLSHVERYFADFLSIMESGDSVKLYSGEKRYTKCKKDQKPNEEDFIPNEIEWPENLFIIGTVNIDETTYMFSPKVLDRANVIEFRISPKEMSNFFVERKDLKMEKLFLNEEKSYGGIGQGMGGSFFEIAKNKTIVKIPEIKGENNILNKFFSELQIVGSEFGYRSATEIELLITKLGIKELVEFDNKLTDNNVKIDIAIMQKLLPKLHGSRKKLVGPLEILAGFCLSRINGSQAEEKNNKKNTYEQFIDEKRDSSKWKINYQISFEKIERMRKNVIDNGFTSYAEA